MRERDLVDDVMRLAERNCRVIVHSNSHTALVDLRQRERVNESCMAGWVGEWVVVVGEGGERARAREREREREREYRRRRHSCRKNLL